MANRATRGKGRVVTPCLSPARRRPALPMPSAPATASSPASASSPGFGQQPGYGQPPGQPPGFDPSGFGQPQPPQKKSNTGLFVGLGLGVLAIVGIVVTLIVVLGGSGGNDSDTADPDTSASADGDDGTDTDDGEDGEDGEDATCEHTDRGRRTLLSRPGKRGHRTWSSNQWSSPSPTSTTPTR